jgi:hypothetical protein
MTREHPPKNKLTGIYGVRKWKSLQFILATW